MRSFVIVSFPLTSWDAIWGTLVPRFKNDLAGSSRTRIGHNTHETFFTVSVTSSCVWNLAAACEFQRPYRVYQLPVTLSFETARCGKICRPRALKIFVISTCNTSTQFCVPRSLVVPNHSEVNRLLVAPHKRATGTELHFRSREPRGFLSPPLTPWHTISTNFDFAVWKRPSGELPSGGRSKHARNPFHSLGDPAARFGLLTSFYAALDRLIATWLSLILGGTPTLQTGVDSTVTVAGKLISSR